MQDNPLSAVDTLTFDVFGTVLNLTGGHSQAVADFLQAHGSTLDPNAVYARWRDRQRIEQYQDNLLMLGHSGYLATCRRAFTYTLRVVGVEYTAPEIDAFMESYQRLKPYADVAEGLKRLAGRYRLVALSNGEQWYLEKLVKENIGFPFDDIISVEHAGVFKPHPAVYRTAAKMLGKEPGSIMMVAAHSFDILGARACGYRGAYVNRYGLPTEDSPYQPDIEVRDFVELAERLG